MRAIASNRRVSAVGYNQPRRGGIVHLDIGNSWFMRRPWWVKALVVIGVLALMVTGLSGCAQLGIPTAQTAPVEPGVSTSTTTEATASTSTVTDSEITPPSSYLPPKETTVAQSPVKLVTATVVRIVDGDTAVFRLANGTQEKVRFIGVDTPESTNKIEPYGKAASAYTAKRLKVGSKVYLEKDVEPRDRYGRLLAYVWLTPPSAITETELRSKQFNAMLAADGYAQQMTIAPNVKYAEYFRSFVQEARAANKGMWAGDGGSDSGGRSDAGAAAVAPAPGPSTSGAAYIGNRNTMKFHIPSCSSVGDMNPNNKVALSSRSKAISGGYVPCGRCRP